MYTVQNELKQYLEATARLFEMQSIPKNLFSRPRLLLKYGKAFETDKNTYAGPRGTPKQCYSNAGRIALENPDMIYVEGIIAHIIPIDHAWLINRKTGRVVDPTIKNNEYARGYFGIPFCTWYLNLVLYKTKVWGLIHHTNPGLFKQEVSPKDFIHPDHRN